MINANDMNYEVAVLKLFIPLKRIAETDDHIIQNEAAAFLDVNSTQHNFIIGTEVGDKQIAAFEKLVTLGEALNITIAGEVVDVASKLGELKDVVIALANKEYKPYESLSEYDFKVAKSELSPIQVINNKGYAVIRYPFNVVSHNVKLLAKNPRTDKLEVIGSFGNVSKEGAYDCAVPSTYRAHDLFVYNYGGVIV